MTPSPANDPGLPRLWDALDEATMMELLGDRLPLLRCGPRYVRYKPATSCLVQYDIALQLADGGVLDTTAHVTIHADGRGRNRAGTNRMRRLLERAAAQAPEMTGRHAVYIPELRGLVQVFPVDYDLRPLVRVADPASMRKVFSRSLAPDAGTVRQGHPHLVRYKPGRKALFLFTLEHGSHDRVFAKVLKDDRGERLFAATTALHRAGIATPQALMHSPRLRLIAHEHAAGTRLASLRGMPSFEQWMEPVAASLARLQAVPISGLPVRRLANDAATITQTAQGLGMLLPALAPRLTRLGDRIGGALTSLADEPRTAHGDFYDDQTLVSVSDVTIIDLDELHLGHPLNDIGNMLAHLRSGDARGDGTGEARERFLRASLGGSPYTTSDVAPFEAAALLRLAPGPFRRLEPDWPERIEQIVSLAERTLKDGGQAVPGIATPRPDAIRDPKLPYLPTLQDPARMTREFAAMGTLHTIEVIRHKPGRRAILRYTIQREDGEIEHLYGKTFASERGPRVFATGRMIASAQAFGPDVQVPEPITYTADLKLLVQRSVPGQPIESALLGADRERATGVATRIATALHRLHASGLDLGRRHDVEKELAALPERVDAIGVFEPGLLSLASGLLTAVRQRIQELKGSWRWRPIHRDIYHDQVLIDDDGLAIVDLDDAAMSEPAIDIANVIAHLQLLGIQRHDDSNALAEVIDAFLEESLRLDPGFDLTLLDVLQAATLLRLAGIHISRSHGIRVATLLLNECASMLSTGEPASEKAHWGIAVQGNGRRRAGSAD